MKHDLVTSVHDALTVYVAEGQTVCVALSGGADSVCLLRVLLELREKFAIKIIAVHVNHQLRGAESERDAAFCVSLCAIYNIPLQTINVDVEAYSAKHHTSVELSARACRYAAFETVKADWILTAHTATDNTETFLHRLIRGSSLHGLCAIPPQNGRYLRVMLDVTRKEVEAYLKKCGQGYVVDSTNDEDTYTRNQIRHQITPPMYALNPSLDHTVAATIRALRRDEEYLTQEAQRAYHERRRGSSLIDLMSLSASIQMRVIALYLEEGHIDYNATLLERLLSLVRTGGRWSVNRQMDIIAEKGTLTLVPIERVVDAVPLQIGENHLYSTYVLEAKLITDDFVAIAAYHKAFPRDCFDYDKIVGAAKITPRVSGATIHLPNRDFTTQLKKVISANVPRAQRQFMHWIQDDCGVIYAQYIGIDERVRPDASTRRLMTIEIREVRS